MCLLVAGRARASCRPLIHLNQWQAAAGNRPGASSVVQLAVCGMCSASGYRSAHNLHASASVADSPMDIQLRHSDHRSAYKSRLKRPVLRTETDSPFSAFTAQPRFPLLFRLQRNQPVLVCGVCAFFAPFLFRESPRDSDWPAQACTNSRRSGRRDVKRAGGAAAAALQRHHVKVQWAAGGHQGSAPGHRHGRARCYTLGFG